MSHNHSHHHHHGSSGNLRVAFFLNLGFTVIEIIGGLYTNSIAILSDALHDLGDSLSLGLAWYLENYSKKKGDAKYSYGYGRYSLLGALINAIVLITGSTIILFEAIPRILDPEYANAPGMIILAVLGIIVNGLAVLKLKDEKGINAKVVGLHLLEDVLGWTAVLIAGIVLMFWNVPVIDPILAVLLTSYILYNVVKNLRQTLSIFLQASPGEINVAEIDAKLRSLDGVISTHHTHVWSLDGAKHVLTTHIVVKDETDREGVMSIKKKAKDIAFGSDVSHITVEVDFENEDCVMRGVDC